MQQQESSPSGHIPVLLKEVLHTLAPASGEVVLDVTLGLGGHAEAFLRAIGPSGRLIGIDADERNLRAAQARLSPFAERTAFHHLNFGALEKLLPLSVDILFADLGLSSPHLDDPARGFTFRVSAPLDLRFDTAGGRTGSDLLNEVPEAELTSIFSRYGELQRSATLARVLKAEAQKNKQWTTDDVKVCAEKVFRYKTPQVLPQIFQALRIAVNDELASLETLLSLIPDLLRPGGRCAVISYHSLEDRLVKNAFRSFSTPEKDETTGAVSKEAPFTLITRKPVRPSVEEVGINPRSRSALLRVMKCSEGRKGKKEPVVVS